MHRIGTHIGNQTLGSLPEVDPFIQHLRQGHGPLGRVAAKTGAGLLQRAGDVGRGGTLGDLLGSDTVHLEGAALQITQDPGRGLLALDLGLLTIDTHQLDRERIERGDLLAHHGAVNPEGLRVECLNLLLTFTDDPQGDRLHTSGTQAPPDAAPQHGADHIPHDAIQYAPRLLGIHTILVDRGG